MSSKNNKPANNPVSNDKKNQSSTASEASKPVANKSDNLKPAADANKPAPGKADDKNKTNDKSPVQPSSANNVKSTGNADKKNIDKANDTLAKPVPPSAKPSNTAKPTTTPNSTSHSSDKNSAKKATDKADSNKTTPSTGGKGNGTTPPPPGKTNTPKQSPLPLIISLIALGVGGYALYNSMQQPQSHPEEVEKLQTEVANLQKALSEKPGKEELTQLTDNVNNLEKQLSEVQASPATSIDEAQIQSLISEQVDQAKQSLQDSLSAQPQQNAQPGLSKDQVNTMIKEALVSNNSDQNTAPAIDFSSEIDTIKQDKAEIEQYLQQIKQEGESLKSSLSQAAEEAKSSLDQSVSQVEEKISAADQQPIVYPLINALTLAEVASNARQYGVASQYLEQAKASFDDLHLNQPPYADFAGQLDELAQKTADLAKQQNSQQEIDAIINGVNDWPFISTDPENVLDTKPAEKPTEDWKDDIKQIGNSILSSTVTITKNDAAGLTWVNENPHLQQIIRENVRLDLAMIRNALLIGDQKRAQQISATLRDQIGRYFNTDANEVKQAMNKLDELTQQQSDAPDIAALINSIQQAG